MKKRYEKRFEKLLNEKKEKRLLMVDLVRKADSQLIPRYILVDQKPVLCDDALLWDDFMINIGGRRVAVSSNDRLGITVSTTFLGIDHNFSGKGDPILFETMVLTMIGENCLDSFTRRYCTWEEAVEGHDYTIDRVEARSEDGYLYDRENDFSNLQIELDNQMMNKPLEDMMLKIVNKTAKKAKEVCIDNNFEEVKTDERKRSIDI